MSDIKAKLERHVVCKDLDDTQLSTLEAIARVETFAADQFVYRENDPATDLHLITSGRVTIEIASPRGVRSIETLDHEDAYGLSWVTPLSRWLFDARAEEHVEVVVIDGVALAALCESDPVLGMRIMRQLVREVTQRLHATRMRLMDVYQ